MLLRPLIILLLIQFNSFAVEEKNEISVGDELHKVVGQLISVQDFMTEFGSTPMKCDSLKRSDIVLNIDKEKNEYEIEDTFVNQDKVIYLVRQENSIDEFSIKFTNQYRDGCARRVGAGMNPQTGRLSAGKCYLYSTAKDNEEVIIDFSEVPKTDKPQLYRLTIAREGDKDKSDYTYELIALDGKDIESKVSTKFMGIFGSDKISVAPTN